MRSSFELIRTLFSLTRILREIALDQDHCYPLGCLFAVALMASILQAYSDNSGSGALNNPLFCGPNPDSIRNNHFGNEAEIANPQMHMQWKDESHMSDEIYENSMLIDLVNARKVR